MAVRCEITELPVEQCIAKTIGANIRSVRRELHWTQDRLGSALGVNGEAVGRWEQGRCPVHPDGLAALAVALGVGVDRLTGEGGEPE
jgi:transcriptional regulator with XRE-family HTH domain